MPFKDLREFISCIDENTELILFPRLVGSQLDPSEKKIGWGSGLGIDATRPVGEPFPEVVEIPGVENVSFEQ